MGGDSRGFTIWGPGSIILRAAKSHSGFKQRDNVIRSSGKTPLGAEKRAMWRAEMDTLSPSLDQGS